MVFAGEDPGDEEKRGGAGRSRESGRREMKGLLLAIQFLTIIPVPSKREVTEEEVARAAAFFPLVGALNGLFAGFAALLLVPVFSARIASGLVLLLLTAVNGGFHLDGLADTFDAIAVKSTGDRSMDRQKRLSVMKESTTGAIGVVAIAMTVLLKYLFISALFEGCQLRQAAYLLFLTAVYSKWAMVAALFHGKAARAEGLGRIFIEGTGAAVFLSSLLLLAIISLVAARLSPSPSGTDLGFMLLAGLSLYALSLLWTFFCGRRFGGLTGDTAGALAEMADVLFLAIAFLWFSHR